MLSAQSSSVPSSDLREIEEGLRELDRQEAKENFEGFARYFLPAGHTFSAHHRLFISALQRVADGQCPRLMIFAPPGSAKSWFASRLFPAYYHSRHPDRDMIGASHTIELASDFGRWVRDTIDGQDFRRTFGFGVSRKNSAAHHWATERGGEYVAAGVGKAIAGRRADLAIVDDPVKSREEASSLGRLEGIWRWKIHDLWPRLKPHASVVVFHTRWSDFDLAGRLLEDMEKGGEKWEVLMLRMEAEPGDVDPLGRKPGERLWPEWFTEEMVAQAKRDALSWASLYQQRPQPEGGLFFERDCVRWYKSLPAHLTVYIAADYAVTAGAGDWTVIGVFGIDPDENIYVIDWWRAQASSDVWVDKLCDLILQWKPVEVIEETGQIAKGVGPFLEKRQRERKAFCAHKLYTSSANKPTRAQAIRGRWAQGKVYLPVQQTQPVENGFPQTEFVDILLDEVLRFPMAGMPDDQVDTLSLLGRRLAELSRPQVEQTREEQEAARIEIMKQAAKVPTFNQMVEISERRGGQDRGRIA